MLKLIATSTFGLEASVKRELKNLGYEITGVSEGRIEFAGGYDAVVDLNINLRASDRILIKVGEFNAYSFDELFENAKSFNWQDFITKDGKFTVVGKSVKSKLYSISDCQSIIKKAIVEKLKSHYHTDWFEETGPEYKVLFSLLKDRVVLSIDTTGPSLHKRGYRDKTVEAPIKETLAFAMIELSYWRKNRILLDPFCGSGTIAIEAAMISKNIAPGLYRSFACEKWPQIPRKVWTEKRREMHEKIQTVSGEPIIYASDIDPEAVNIAKYSAKKAGVEDMIVFEEKEFKDVVLPGDYGVMITNPPYGGRIGEEKEVEELYRQMGNKMRDDKTWSVYVITSNEEFEKLYGRKADAKRKLFNGNIRTDYYQYFGQRPPKQ